VRHAAPLLGVVFDFELAEFIPAQRVIEQRCQDRGLALL